MTALHTAAGPDLTAAQLYALLKLRVDVFVVEQECPYPELDGRDLAPDTVHLWWQPADAPEPLACLRILPADAGRPVRIGRVCTAKDARGTGLGGKLMGAALAHVGEVDTVLDAQVQAQGMYARFGYVPVGDPFDEDGIPHITMRRPASAPD
ncbi:ElaA protein [Actinokineospora alba]|uniref:ElaA protein n=1 Tax=Actinokineospora alba TaxID=504798 RepID=A0A1H0IA61_9PSEU|nr:GNAT family N-acetyltransferase [Actinokineospora alba]TDP64542.1 ElaA protein [Actinokineospora alba]SDI87569.1 ElaA protein [Actinokineospora alba]SDO28140.1 ElaA protein [Actinokineospora alba]